MHKSLTRRANLTLIAIYSIGVAVLMIVTGNWVFLSCCVGAVFGVVAGILQRRALRSHAAAFLRTTTAMEVRRVLTSSRAGRVAVAVTWVSAIVLLVLAMFFGQRSLAAASWFSGFLAFMAVRDAVAYTALPVAALAPRVRDAEP